MDVSEIVSRLTMEIKRSKRLKGTASLQGDARQGFQALLMAALAEGPTKLENLPETPWFKESIQAFIHLGYAQQALDGHWLVHGGSKPVDGPEPVRVRHEADFLALAALLSAQGVKRVLEVDLDGVSADVIELLGKIIHLESPGDFTPVEAAPAALEPEIEPEPVEPDEYDLLAAELNASLDAQAAETEAGSDSAEAYRAITPEKPRRTPKEPSAGELRSGPAPEDEGRFLRIVPGPLRKKAADLVAGHLPGPPQRGAGPARLTDLKWDEPQAKLILLMWHLAAGKSLDLSLLKSGPELLETVAAQFGAPLKVDRNNDDEGDELARRIARQMRAAGKQEAMTKVRLSAPVKFKAQSYTVPGDLTETAALVLAATLLKGSDLTLEGVILNPTRAGFLAALRRMGADIEVLSRRERQGETLGTLRVRSADLLGKRFGSDNLPAQRDEIFLLMVAAAFAEGETLIRDISHLRHLRRDLLKSFAAALKAAGVEIGEIEDGLVIRGRSDYDGATYDCQEHTPLALAALVMGLKSHGATQLLGADCLDANYPGLLDRVAALGAPDKPVEKAGKGKTAERNAAETIEAAEAASAPEDEAEGESKDVGEGEA